MLQPTGKALKSLVDEMNADPDCRVVILTGEGVYEAPTNTNYNTHILTLICAELFQQVETTLF